MLSIRFACLMLAAAFFVGAANTSHAAAGNTADQPTVIGETLFVPVQAGRNCPTVRAFCREQFRGGGRGYRNCVLSRGCRLERRLPYCQRAYRRCAVNFVPGRRPFRRCMRDVGC